MAKKLVDMIFAEHGPLKRLKQVGAMIPNVLKLLQSLVSLFSKVDGLLLAAGGLLILVPTAILAASAALINAHQCAFEQENVEVTNSLVTAMSVIENGANNITVTLSSLSRKLLNDDSMKRAQEELNKLLDKINQAYSTLLELSRIVDRIDFLAELGTVKFTIPGIPGIFDDIVFDLQVAKFLFDNPLISGLSGLISPLIENLFEGILGPVVFPLPTLPNFSEILPKMEVDLNFTYASLFSAVNNPFSVLDDWIPALDNSLPTEFIPCERLGQELADLITGQDSDDSPPEDSETDGSPDSSSNNGRILLGGLKAPEAPMIRAGAVLRKGLGKVLLKMLPREQEEDKDDDDDNIKTASTHRKRSKHRKLQHNAAAGEPKVLFYPASSQLVLLADDEYKLLKDSSETGEDDDSTVNDDDYLETLSFPVFMDFDVVVKPIPVVKKCLEITYIVTLNNGIKQVGPSGWMSIDKKTGGPKRLWGRNKSQKTKSSILFSEAVQSSLAFPLRFKVPGNPWGPNWDFKPYARVLKSCPTGIVKNCPALPSGSKCLNSIKSRILGDTLKGDYWSSTIAKSKPVVNTPEYIAFQPISHYATKLFFREDLFGPCTFKQLKTVYKRDENDEEIYAVMRDKHRQSFIFLGDLSYPEIDRAITRLVKKDYMELEDVNQPVITESEAQGTLIRIQKHVVNMCMRRGKPDSKGKYKTTKSFKNYLDGYSEEDVFTSKDHMNGIEITRISKCNDFEIFLPEDVTCKKPLETNGMCKLGKCGETKDGQLDSFNGVDGPPYTIVTEHIWDDEGKPNMFSNWVPAWG